MLQNITDPKELKMFLSCIYDYNQEFKKAKRKKDSNYLITGGLYIAFKTDYSECGHNMLDSELHELNGSVNGSSLYNFFKDYKKNITSAELYKDHFVLKTDIPNFMWSSQLSTQLNDEFLIDKYFESINLRHSGKKDILSYFPISKEVINNIMETDSPYVVNFQIDKNMTIVIKFVPRIFIIKPTECFITIKDLGNSLYAITLEAKNKKIPGGLVTHFVIANYNNKLSNITINCSLDTTVK